MSHAQAAAIPGQDLQSGVAKARERSDALFKIVRPDALYDRPIPERHRIIFYIGHLEAFDWNLIARHGFDLPSLNPRYDQLFAFGIDPVDGGLPGDVASDWPRLEEVLEYKRRIRTRVDECLDAAMHGGCMIPASVSQLFHVAIEHRLMHIETLAYMFHQMPYEKKIAPPVDPPCDATQVQPRMVQIPKGTARLGLDPLPEAPFGWDNEFMAHTVEVPAFAIDALNITNRQFSEFISAGGYDDRRLWSDADWEWKMKAGIRHPSFWAQRNGEWRYRAMFAEVPLPLDWPVYVSHAEASAYARWVCKALPSEAQFHRAAFSTLEGKEREYPWGLSAPAPRHGNFDFQRWNPAPVGAHSAGNSAFGVADLIGNGWEWTSTIFEGFTGFQAFPFYPGYSANFFDGQHYVIKGGSAQTAARLLRRSFRNWFQPHYPYIYATFRCVENQI